MKRTPKLKRQIRKDWHTVFPQMVIHGTTLLRRAGPLLIGVGFGGYSGGDAYRPLNFVHVLAKQNKYIGGSMLEYLRTRRGGEDWVFVEDHEARYQDAARRLAKQARLPLDGAVGLDETLKAYRQWSRASKHSLAPNGFENMALLAAWCFSQRLAQDLVEEGYRTMRWWPRIDRKNFEQYKEGISNWYERVSAAIADLPAIRATVEDEIKAHRLEKIPVSEFYGPK